MKIIVVSDGVFPYSMGGSHRLIYEACTLLHEQGHRVTCIVPEITSRTHIHNPGSRDAEVPKFNVIRFPRGGGNGLAAKLRSAFGGFRKPLEKVLKDEGADVINVHYLPAMFSLRSVARRRKVHYTFHGPWAGEFQLSVSGRMDAQPRPIQLASRLVGEPLLHLAGSLIEKWTLKRAHSFMVMSEFMKTLLCGRYAIAPELVRVIPAGVNTRKFFPERDLGFRDSLRSGRGHLLVTARRLEKRMGLENLVRACALLVPEFDDFMLLIGGKGIQQDYLQSLIKRLGLSRNVRMIGFIPEADLRRFMSAADLFILPSVALEGFGLVVLEAMACGTPVVVTPNGGPREVVVEFDPRLVLDSTDPHDVASSLRELLKPGFLTPELSDRCVRYVAARYSWRSFSERYIAWVS